jgi:TolA-binding protein
MTHRDPLAEALRSALDADAPAMTTRDDEALLARAVDRAMAASIVAVTPDAVAAPSPAAAEPPVPLRTRSGLRLARTRLLRVALPAAAALVATVAMAAIYINSRPPPPASDVAHLPNEAVTAAVAPSAPAAHAAPAVVRPGDGAPTISVDDLPTVSSGGSGSATRNESAPAAVDPAATSTPADLFRDANASRRAGDVDHAVVLYSALVTRYADTPEALAARVSLGRVLLDRRDDPAGALAQFDAYLRSTSSDGALAEEARLGRALVFQRQGRQEEERRAWHELLERHPDSLYASRARERLRALAPAEAAPSPPPP